MHSANTLFIKTVASVLRVKSELTAKSESAVTAEIKN